MAITGTDKVEAEVLLGQDHVVEPTGVCLDAHISRREPFITAVAYLGMSRTYQTLMTVSLWLRLTWRQRNIGMGNDEIPQFALPPCYHWISDTEDILGGQRHRMAKVMGWNCEVPASIH